MNSIRKFFVELSQYPSALIGMIYIIALIIFSIYVVIALPYNEAISLWRGDEDTWYKTPRTAQPTWVNWFREEDLPETLSFNSAESQETKTEEFSNGSNKILISFPFEYDSELFPQEISLYFKSQYLTKEPFVNVKMITPDGRTINLNSFAIGKTHTYRLSQDQK